MGEKPKDISGLLARVEALEKELNDGEEAFKELVERSKKIPQEPLRTVEKSKIIRDFLAKAQADKIKEDGADSN